MPRIDLSFEISALPEGWQGSPDEFAQWFAANVIASIDGTAPSGQIGGARPIEDIGVWYGDHSIEAFINGKYRPISDVPIGALMPYAAIGGSIPENYLLCDGRSLVRADYPDLFGVIGTGWGTPESSATFYIPDCKGRYPVGAGIGEYSRQPGMTGTMRELPAGSYVGSEWATRQTVVPGQPVASMKDLPGGFDPTTNRYIGVQSPALAMNWIIRYR